MPFDLGAALRQHGFRAAGIDQRRLSALGSSNLDRLEALLADAAEAALADGARDEARAAHEARDEIALARRAATEDRPVLPRLRAEFFRPGDALALYLGDTGGEGWVEATVASVAKWHAREWASNPSTRGFYWRVEATTGHTFSTTEPRALHRADFERLLRLFEEDPAFVGTFAENAARDWVPLWAMEAGRTEPMPPMRYARWLLRGAATSGLRDTRGW
jgi:hypothetical protein